MRVNLARSPATSAASDAKSKSWMPWWWMCSPEERTRRCNFTQFLGESNVFSTAWEMWQLAKLNSDRTFFTLGERGTKPSATTCSWVGTVWVSTSRRGGLRSTSEWISSGKRGSFGGWLSGPSGRSGEQRESARWLTIAPYSANTVSLLF